ncbi:beta-aspartyl-peptidase [Litoribrevibacter albus]|uniref:Isoaspartyl dipeptidase n=1 Tax=Litoribrevibacter albus TaxID=1473156 RepID=A0AA37SFS2_9GAMM|nr:beta-aspartyl-peptidase [Litoribrevibacter albus]GLQ33620.1 isoaspartyl dipeptidase [Litoribrevibacter albus]
MYLVKGAEVYSPRHLGQQDVLIAGGQIVAMATCLETPDSLPIKVIDGSGKILAPGLVDSLVHIIGGGGEGGFTTRTPEMHLSDAVKAGVTTLVGVLGTDSVTRTLTNLLAKANALEEEGLTLYCHTGSYQTPARTLFDAIDKDIILIDKFIGVGEVAISDHRSSQPTTQELARLAAQARVGGMLSGKAGIVSVHVGDSDTCLQPLLDVVSNTDIPITQFYPTHINRTQTLLDAGKEFARLGGYLDLTASTTPEILAAGEVKCAEALAQLLEAGVPASQITFSSDGFASLPDFDEAGRLRGLKVGTLTSLLSEVRDAVFDHDVSIENAITVVTRTPAEVLKLPKKGRIEEGADADLILLDAATLELDSVFSKGQKMMADGTVLKHGVFETNAC